jgi:hypothetical protein
MLPLTPSSKRRWWSGDEAGCWVAFIKQLANHNQPAT